MKKLLVLLIVVCLPITALAANVTLSCDANTEADLAGYRVYYGTASRTYDEPVQLGNVTTYSLETPDGETYYFAVTAFDTEGLESDYSNEVSTDFRQDGTLQRPRQA